MALTTAPTKHMSWLKRLKVHLLKLTLFRLTRSRVTNTDRFSKVLQAAGITCIVRRTRGDDIDAACGQLAGDVVDRTKRMAKKKMRDDNAISVNIQQA